MTRDAINLASELASFDARWSPRFIAEMNDIQFKRATLEGEFVWHAHADTDEVFFVANGGMQVGDRDRDATVRAGERCVVPRGAPHITRAARDCHALFIEPRGMTPATPATH